MSNFKQEERYIVVKLKRLTQSEEVELRQFLKDGQIKTEDCVVVEPDWPNYEATWKAIEEIEEGTYDPDEVSHLRQKVERLQARIDELESALEKGPLK